MLDAKRSGSSYHDPHEIEGRDDAHTSHRPMNLPDGYLRHCGIQRRIPCTAGSARAAIPTSAAATAAVPAPPFTRADWKFVGM